MRGGRVWAVVEAVVGAVVGAAVGAVGRGYPRASSEISVASVWHFAF